MTKCGGVTSRISVTGNRVTALTTKGFKRGHNGRYEVGTWTKKLMTMK